MFDNEGTRPITLRGVSTSVTRTSVLDVSVVVTPPSGTIVYLGDNDPRVDVPQFFATRQSIVGAEVPGHYSAQVLVKYRDFAEVSSSEVRLRLDYSAADSTPHAADAAYTISRCG